MAQSGPKILSPNFALKKSIALDTPYKLFLQDGDLDHPLHIKDGLPLHNHMEDPVNVFPHKISTSTLKRGSTGSKRTFLLKEKRESIVWDVRDSGAINSHFGTIINNVISFLMTF